ncbi:23S rRNA (pseudouridine(1915)-N(3))-methyltransferase RlmH [Candidatus Soleaferrea massiliensis]|uniref:23S rRNA (pseudouridine(1915)-N(3))-methyltransferase RlmH n=1 Tax=Candidatus Soleaferrea massiliensis TaxID=1470354 RepID=UPI00058B082E|nr:23S rRNA (pseudouridine(1915)-N(3))-methyltransferase RlmH [Candidatus Soleaferrea massiliensis]
MIRILCVGKLKESYLRAASAEYEKRIGGFDRIGVTELDEYRLPENPSESLIEKGLQKEGVQMLSKIRPGDYVVCMCIDGKQLSSEELAHRLDSLQTAGTSSFVFAIGSSHGLSDDVVKRADLKLSMSRMTFPHQLARVILLEQIYRAFQISRGGKYHK